MFKTLVSRIITSSTLPFTFVIILFFSSNGFSQQVKVGKQIWQPQNLNVEFFQNGDKIPRAQSNEE